MSEVAKCPTVAAVRAVNSDDSVSSSSETSGLLENQAARDSSGTLPGTPKEYTTRLKSTITCIILVGIFLGSFDGTVVAAILSTIASELNALSSIQWVATGYLVACAAFQPLFGKLSDIFGRKALLLTCNILFALGCAICGLSDSLITLVIGRVVTGMGGGGLMTIGTVVMSDFVPLRDRGMFQGIGNICFGTGAALGGIVGGYFAEKLGWRAVFLYQVPLIMVSIFLIIVFLPETSSAWLEKHAAQNEQASEYGTAVNQEAIHYSILRNLGRIDFLGSAALVASISALMLACDLGGKQYSWTDPTISYLALISVLASVLYVYIEKNVAKEPVTPIELFAVPAVVFSSVSIMFCCMTTFALTYYAPIFLASVQGMGPYKVGLSLTGTFITTSAGSFLSGLYIKKTGRYRNFTILSMIISVLGNFSLLFFDENTPGWLIVLSLALHRWGSSVLATVTLVVMLASMPPAKQAVSTSLQYTFRSIGSTVGVAIAAVLFNNMLRSQLSARLPDGSEEIIRKVLDSVDEIGNVPAELRVPIIASYRQASMAVFALSLAESVISAVTVLFIGEKRLHTTLDRQPREEPLPRKIRHL